MCAIVRYRRYISKHNATNAREIRVSADLQKLSPACRDFFFLSSLNAHTSPFNKHFLCYAFVSPVDNTFFYLIVNTGCLL